VGGATLLVCLTLAFTAILIATLSRPDGESMNFGMTIAETPPSVSIFIADNDQSTNLTPSTVGSISTIESNIRVTTHEVYGYDLLINTTNSGGNMLGTNTGSTLTPMPGTINNPIPFTTANCNSWGFATPAESGNYSSAFDSAYTILNNAPTTNISSNFASVPTSLTPIHENISNTITSVDESRSYYFAFCANSNTTPDQYKANIVWTAIAIDEPTIPCMIYS
jgi:hypothetical protein